MIESTFPWTNALLGGAIIGVSTLLMMLSIGRVAGISGIFSSLLKPASTQSWQVFFILGLFLTGILYHFFVEEINVEMTRQLPLYIVGGLLVGFGTRLGNGCTSGHGICGISRFSTRSIIATLVFIGVAVLTVYVLRLVSGN